MGAHVLSDEVTIGGGVDEKVLVGALKGPNGPSSSSVTPREGHTGPCEIRGQPVFLRSHLE